MVAFWSPKPAVRVRVFLFLQEIEVWCNGSTQVFGTCSRSSNLLISTTMSGWPSGQALVCKTS